MIVDIPNTTISKIGKRLQELRDAGGVVTLGRVLTLIIETDPDHVDEAVAAANAASRLHPSRIIVLTKTNGSDQKSQLDAQIRVGGDAGASEVVVLFAHGDAANNPESLVTGLLLPDAPVVAWWPTSCSADPSSTAVGKIASRRITDSAAQRSPREFLVELAKNYAPGDGDMAWTRITLWRAQLAALFDQHLEREVRSITVIGAKESPSADLLGMWLQQRLGKSAIFERGLNGSSVTGISGVRVEFEDGDLEIIRVDQVAQIRQVGAPDSSVLLPRRSDQDCLVEDMRFLGEDEVYGSVLRGFLDN
jgi:glucose-6-phosphate dehydrogenase assembly protein OpcA